jgi:hypothetical protein
MKRPFDTVRDLFFENLDKSLENARYNFSNSEKFMVWIVGFSIAGLSIIVTNLTKFNQDFNHCIIKTILILLSISIISGIIYRWAFYAFQTQFQSIEFYLRGAFSNPDIMETDPKDITNITDIKEVVRLLKMDFGEDDSFILELYEKEDSVGREILLKDLKEHYNKIGEWAKRDFELGLNYAKDTFKKAFGLSEKKADKLFKQTTVSLFNIFCSITTIAFLLSCISFILVIIILCAAY